MLLCYPWHVASLWLIFRRKIPQDFANRHATRRHTTVNIGAFFNATPDPSYLFSASDIFQASVPRELLGV